ncbi:MAG TPA: hypothetical protein VN673_08895 [Clostridia bacterium]|nr:hypothetical protein [Clostridia bacterium]
MAEQQRPPFSSLEDQVRECFGRVVYTHKTREDGGPMQ